MKTRDHNTAYHEAGHALGLWLMDLRFLKVTIEATEDTDGSVLPESLRLLDKHAEHSPSPRVRDRLERKIVATLAGPEAERLVRGRSNHRGAESDYGLAKHLASLVTGGSPAQTTAYLGWLQIRARELLANPTNRPLLDVLAAALIERRTLPGKEAIRILENALRARVWNRGN